MCVDAVIMFVISWLFTVVSLALASLLYWYVSIKGKGGDWGDGFKSAYFQLALRSLRSLGGALKLSDVEMTLVASKYACCRMCRHFVVVPRTETIFFFCSHSSTSQKLVPHSSYLLQTVGYPAE